MRHLVGDLVYYSSDLLDRFDITHGWFTRVGGVSQDPYSSLNMKHKIGDTSACVVQNRELASRALGADPDKLFFANDLAHDNKIFAPKSTDKAGDVTGFDAVMVQTKGQIAALSVADCIPLFLADTKHRIVMVVHVGWRGLIAGAVEHSVNAMVAAGVPFTNIVAAIGPANRVETYEFSQNDLGPIRRIFPADQIIREKNSKWYVDVVQGCKLKLQSCSISKIDDCGINSFLRLDEFYSYRAEQPDTGRFGAFITL